MREPAPKKGITTSFTQKKEGRANKAVRRGRGRPRLEFDLNYVAELGELGASNQELADVFGCSLKTIQRLQAEDPMDKDKGNFVASYRKGRAGLCHSLRQKQIEMAMNGNTTMLVHLGKVYLGQTDRIDTKTEVTMSNIVPVINLIAKKPEEK